MLRSSSIHTLFFSSSPSTISGFIISVVINAVDAVLGRRLGSHIDVEVLKGIQPTLADRYSATSPVFESFVLRIVAPFFYCYPRIVFWNTIFTMFGVNLNCDISMETSATCCVSSIKITPGYNNHISAIAKTCPVIVFSFVGKRDYRKSFEFHSRNVLDLFKDRISWMLSHKLNSYLVLVKAHFQQLTGDGLALLSGTNYGGASVK